ncbi:MAG: helix-turn-helix domain-containing protein [Rhizobiales bacterium]|nr:helix-turn-helix domain-containing protein [Hyphomicrobiales bacterium]
MEREPLFIGRLAALTGVDIETIRYYERIALVSAPARTAGRYRIYGEQHIRRLAFIRCSRELGFSLEDIRHLLRVADRGNAASAEIRRLTLARLADVHGKIASLNKLERALKTMTNACQPGNQCSCPIIDALSAAA